MIHQAWGIVAGNASDMLDTAELLERINGQLSTIYQKRSGQDASVVDKWVSDETWFTGPEAVEAGLADTVSDEAADIAAAAKLEAFGYAKVPESLKAQEPTGAQKQAEADRQADARRDENAEADEKRSIAMARQKARHAHAMAMSK
jgi:hypothetical protein